MRLFLLSAALAATATAQNYFPLQTGNQWVYKASSPFGSPFVAEVNDARDFNGDTYYWVTGLKAPGAWLRTTDAGDLVEYDVDSQSVSTWVAFSAPEGGGFASSIGPCSALGVLTSKSSKLSVPVGDYSAAEISYSGPCAVAGITSDFYVPNVGLAKRIETSFTGPRTYELIYARVNGFITLQQPEVSFSLSATSTVKPGDPITARFTIRNGGSDPLALHFNSGQIHNIIIRDAKGVEVYNASLGIFFTQIIQTINVVTEKNWVVTFTPRVELEPGRYALEAYLTTADRQPYRAQVDIEVR